jgi:LPXTG-motif cell wall-anchored protein
VIDGLTNGTDYTFTAVAGNAAGESVVSDPSDIGTPQAPTTTTTVSPTTTTPSGPLPYTGSDSRGMVSMAMVFVAIGGAVTILARRRRSTIG